MLTLSIGQLVRFLDLKERKEDSEKKPAGFFAGLPNPEAEPR
jgi:hypothetical protein